MQGPGTIVKQEQEEISCNHVQDFIPGSVCDLPDDAVVVVVVAAVVVGVVVPVSILYTFTLLPEPPHIALGSPGHALSQYDSAFLYFNFGS